MAFSVVQTNDSGSSQTASGSPAQPLAGNTTIGNAVVLVIIGATSTVGAVQTISSPIGTFVKVNAFTFTGGFDWEIWVCLAATGAADTVTCTLAGAAGYFVWAQEWTPGASAAVSLGDATGTPSPAALTYAGATAGQAVVVAATTESSISTGPSSPWTSYNGSGAEFSYTGGVDVAWQEVASTGSITASWTLGGSIWLTWGVALNPMVAPSVSGEAGSNAYGLGTAETLSAVVSPGTAATTVSFNYGPTNSYGSSTGSVTVPATAGPTLVRIPVTGLSNGSTYHFQCVATNSVGTADGSDTTFTTGTYTLPTATDFPGPSWLFEAPYDPDDFLERLSGALSSGVTANAGVANVSVQADNAAAKTVVPAGAPNISIVAHNPTPKAKASAGAPNVAVTALEAEGVINKAPAGTGQVSVTARNASTDVVVTAGVANVAVAAHQPGLSVGAPAAAVTVAAHGAIALVAPHAGAGAVSVAGHNPKASGTATAGVGAVSVAGKQPIANTTVLVGVAEVSVEAYNATANFSEGIVAYPGVAEVSVAALSPTAIITTPAGRAEVTGTAYDPTVSPTVGAGVAEVSAKAYNATGHVPSTADAGVAEVSVAALKPGLSLGVGPAEVTATAYRPGVSVVAHAGVAAVVVAAEAIVARVAVRAGLGAVTVATSNALPRVSALPSPAQTHVEAFTAACGAVVTAGTAQVTVQAFDPMVRPTQGVAYGFVIASSALGSVVAASASGGLLANSASGALAADVASGDLLASSATGTIT